MSLVRLDSTATQIHKVFKYRKVILYENSENVTLCNIFTVFSIVFYTHVICTYLPSLKMLPSL